MKMTVKVTKEDIVLGTPLHGGLCPIALALKRNQVKGVCVDDETIDGVYKGCPFWINLPEKAKAFVHSYDLNKPVKPFCFTLDIL